MSKTSPDHPHGTSKAGGNHANWFKFWGVRGSIPTPGKSTVHYGGNTSCIEVRADGEIIILDAGTGIRPLGNALIEEFKGRPLNITLLISHTHWDHIQGFPFFMPAYNAANKLRILGYEGARAGLATTFAGQMESPYFPIALQQMPGHIVINELKELKFSLGKVRVQACFLNHPGICVGYRVYTGGGASVAYLPDNEPYGHRHLPEEGGDDDVKIAKEPVLERELIEFISGADALILDSQYDDDEYEKHISWGHGCVRDSVALALKAKVKRLFLFHHDPNHDDEHVNKMLSHARQLVRDAGAHMAVEAAREGEQVGLG
ncbi:MAG TPA: MBL fold metallo-hydrolase [Chthoniobacteraceae bacterium]|nr:MBL fold metallo-hydrolase [Chthoniobacteraceae bacterium]